VATWLQKYVVSKFEVTRIGFGNVEFRKLAEYKRSLTTPRRYLVNYRRRSSPTRSEYAPTCSPHSGAEFSNLSTKTTTSPPFRPWFERSVRKRKLRFRVVISLTNDQVYSGVRVCVFFLITVHGESLEIDYFSTSIRNTRCWYSYFFCVYDAIIIIIVAFGIQSRASYDDDDDGVLLNYSRKPLASVIERPGVVFAFVVAENERAFCCFYNHDRISTRTSIR